jgi:hypothetical protein
MPRNLALGAKYSVKGNYTEVTVPMSSSIIVPYGRKVKTVSIAGGVQPSQQEILVCIINKNGDIQSLSELDESIYWRAGRNATYGARTYDAPISDGVSVLISNINATRDGDIKYFYDEYG